MPEALSLLRFVLDRLDEDGLLALENLPRYDSQTDPEFNRRFLERGNVRARLERDRQIIAAVTEAMSVAQGAAPIPSGPQTDPASVLGSEIFKRYATTYRDHRDYSPDWAWVEQ